MKSTVKRAAVVAFCLAAVVVSSNVALAHHSAAGLFSSEVEKTINGTIKEWRFVNPHPALIMDIKNDAGAVEEWRVEFAAARSLTTNFGWTRSTIKPGEQVKVIGYPYFGGKKTMFAVRVTLASGKEYVVRPPRDAAR
jgi:hypothetical protein